MTTTALSASPSHEIVGYQKWGDQIKTGVRAVLEARFAHRNADGTIYVPRIASSVVYAPWYHVITLEPQALWHFSERDLLHEDVLNAIAGTVHRSARYISQVPGESGKPAQKGIAYVITLHDVPALEQAPLPATYKVDLATRPAGDLMIPLGMGRSGVVWRSLHDIGHALICGTTGSGKSTFLHSAIAALTLYTPEQVRLVLIDPKRSEFPAWGGLPHLMHDIATTETQAAETLGELARLVDERGEMLAGELCRDIYAYNKRVDTPMQPVVCIIDECLDLVALAGSRGEFAQCLKTLAVRGRSAGVYVWAATQHASAVDGLPRVVNVNLTSRFVFRVADAHAARSAGCPGAEKIAKSRPGRMLAKLDEIETYQTPYLDDDELLAVARRVAGVPVARAKHSELNDEVRMLAEWALGDERGGYLSLADIARLTGKSKRQVERLAARLEQRGWLRKDRTAGNKRLVTDELIVAMDAREVAREVG